jgi:protein phosphatase 1L
LNDAHRAHARCVWCGIVAGDVPRVDGQLAVARAFGDKSLKVHLSATPDIRELDIDEETELLILASDGLWKVRT